MKKVLFICTGNYYRSRYAEIIFNEKSAESKAGWHAFSRGTRTSGNGNIGPISPYTIHRLAQKGFQSIDITRYPQQLKAYDLVEASIAIAFKEAEHRAFIEQNFPLFAHKVQYLNIHDIDVLEASVALQQIDELIDDLFLKIRKSISAQP